MTGTQTLKQRVIDLDTRRRGHQPSVRRAEQGSTGPASLRPCANPHASGRAKHLFVEQSMEQSLDKWRQLATAVSQQNEVDRAQNNPI
jgi:hypothetical protein